MRVYIRRKTPRTLYLTTKTHVLSLRIAPNENKREGLPTVIVEFQPSDVLDLNRVEPTAECFGCVGLVSIKNDIFLCVITQRSRAASPTPGRTIWNVHDVMFYSLTKSYSDVEESEHPCHELRKLIVQGGFFYSSDFDLTARIEGGDKPQPRFSTPADGSFMWNRAMTKGLREFRDRLSHEDQQALDAEGFLTTLIRGFAATSPVRLYDQQGYLTVLSRQSWLRAGTRYNSRGIDDDGNVANFVETETVLWLENNVQFGFVQLRGSVPLFWEQDPQLLTAKISFTRSVEATEPAFRKHFDSLFDRFGSVHIVDLLACSGGSRGSSTGGSKRPSRTPSMHSISSTSSMNSGMSTGETVTEGDVSLRYQDMASRVPGLRYTHFDFHKEVAGAGYSNASKLIARVQDSMLEFGFYSYNPSTDASETEQIGVFRVNCLDCLDRTNLIQQLISKDALDLFVDYHGIEPTEELWQAHSGLWADNGDQLSQNYTGTGALKSSFTRSGRMNLAGALSDMSKSVSRLYINNFVDKGRQQAIETLLGRVENQRYVAVFDPINDHVREEMKQRTREYLSSSEVNIFAATFNVNGKMFNRGSTAEIDSWLYPDEIRESGTHPDIYVIGFQELVELTTSQILNVDPSKKLYWEDLVLRCLNSHGEQYILLRSGQLVGIAIMMFVKKSVMHNVTEVEGTSKKTALGGITGNKGGVAIGFKYASTRFMFINSHLAAGMHNLEDRHNDFKLLSNGLRLTGNRRMKDADVVLWLGDFNYRVDLPNDTARKILEMSRAEEAIPRLLAHDQLINQMEKGETFPYFNEQKITFLPTYKYDPGTNNFDTSDKQRTPAWTDRILVRGAHISGIAYNSVPTILFSDHRPVYACYNVDVAVIDEEKAERIYSQLYDKRKFYLKESNDPRISNTDAQVQDDGTVSGLPLPHPARDSNKWWSGGGMPAKIPFNPPNSGMVLNPDKINPFGSELPDFIKKPVPPPPRSASGSSSTPSVSGSTTGSTNNSVNGSTHGSTNESTNGSRRSSADLLSTRDALQTPSVPRKPVSTDSSSSKFSTPSASVTSSASASMNSLLDAPIPPPKNLSSKPSLPKPLPKRETKPEPHSNPSSGPINLMDADNFPPPPPRKPQPQPDSLL